MVLILGAGQAPELEETFAGGPVVPWTFENLPVIEEGPDEIHPEMIDEWIASAAVPGATSFTMAETGLRSLEAVSGGSARRFLSLAYAAIEDAALRGAHAVDEAAVAAALEGAEAAHA
jgi:hypothetical protein